MGLKEKDENRGKKTKDTCDIEERKVKKWIKEYEDMTVSGGIGLEKMRGKLKIKNIILYN